MIGIFLGCFRCRCLPRKQILAALVVVCAILGDVRFVVIVGFEEFLDTIAAKLSLAFADSFSIFPFFVVYMICVKVVDVDIRRVR